MNNRYKLFSLFIILVIFFFSISCVGRLNSMFFNTDEKIVEKKFNQILVTLKNKDKDALKAMFSKKALEESEMIDESINYLFSFFQGEVVSWKRDGGLLVSYSFDYGNRVKEIKSFFNIDTNKQKYLVFILDYIEDTANPENVGLYTLRIIKAEDEKTQFGYWQDMKMPGVYYPVDSEVTPD